MKAEQHLQHSRAKLRTTGNTDPHPGKEIYTLLNPEPGSVPKPETVSPGTNTVSLRANSHDVVDSWDEYLEELAYLEDDVTGSKIEL